MVAEAVGTFFLVFPGVAAPMLGKSVPLLDIALANGLGLAIGISATLAVSGGALNPAVTITLWALGKLKAGIALLYIIAELVGATIAALLLHSLIPGGHVAMGTPAPGHGITALDAAGLECIMTFLLVSAVLNTIVDRQAPKIAGLGVGLIVVADVLAGGPLTGAAMNPARAFGPELVSGMWTGAWAYWVGPIVGGLIAGLIYKLFLQSADTPVSTTAGN
jgi:aquaporin Z